MRRYGDEWYPIVMTPTATQQLAMYKGQALVLCWLVQQPLGTGGHVLEGLTRTLAFSRPVSGTEWAAVPREDREREARAFHQRVLRLFRRGLAIRCLAVAKVLPPASSRALPAARSTERRPRPHRAGSMRDTFPSDATVWIEGRKTKKRKSKIAELSRAF